MSGGDRERMIRRLALAALAGQLFWLAYVLFAGLFEPGYSEVRDPVSYLGARTAASPWVFDAVVAVIGLSTIAAAAALSLDGPGGLRGRLGPVLLALTGLAQILDGFPFPADCRDTIDAGCRVRDLAGELSWRSYAHGWAYILGATALLLSVFALAWRFRGDGRWTLRLPSLREGGDPWRIGADRLALGAGVLAVGFFAGLFFVAGDEPDGHYGIVQRIALLAGLIWVVALALALLDLHGRRRMLGARGP